MEGPITHMYVYPNRPVDPLPLPPPDRPGDLVIELLDNDQVARRAETLAANILRQLPQEHLVIRLGVGGRNKLTLNAPHPEIENPLDFGNRIRQILINQLRMPLCPPIELQP
ncbi:MAG: hypothetical protein A3D96_02880 [Chlamydiae bacterium RIFCSPHIGHO2_12_FULL_44_59]|nr:MAG: hypothetical protein A2796_07230 [Chlamydiae bacterium RIFCSPHIGHO2_01_FULL_44_39]OGN56597.1 MAG: hypothetical protein A3C42_05365 [Chlamydiae bacterium RIFCSPHIGHO2_02_FULL_45_9]OGN61026.1 MAG: hypothetical protein A3D96_02880 [Chlamydiae bacterium RIFCSPHIGHO2_12_FULL_44_59]OGN66802.1 MAG: hypothetical protein A2978_00365 [Chlamydiae bacterium RIFCSPLOWO2_01_FULL_44_52]OGN69996.1 MAG: hypothetical protein A3I67_01680 [Chlamydiae bacterium RIFCSPLOWO2_02_FULL_45_22]OGN71067.1 MAG: hyp